MVANVSALSERAAQELRQIGEFSFILAALRMSLGLLSREARNLILAAAIISIALNPLMFRLADAIQRRQSGPPPGPVTLSPNE